MQTTVSLFPWQMWDHMWAWWWIFPLFVMAMIVACAAMFVLPHRSADPIRSALRILNGRLARGEIPAEEYAAKKSAILSRDG
jgi:uncharacterized membrane protein